MRFLLLPVTNMRWCTSTTTVTSRHRCKCFWSLQIAFLSYALLLLSAQAASTPTPTITPHHRSQPAPFDFRPFEQHHATYDTPHHHQRRHPRPFPTPAPIPNPAPAQFWAGWPKETYTVIRTITQTEHGAAEAPFPEETTVVDTAEVTTTLYDSNLPASGTLTVTSTTTLPPEAGMGAVGTITTTSTTTSTTSPLSSQSGTLTRTRTATIETRLPQETQWTPADIPRFAECLPGDEDYEEPGVLSLTKEQKPTLIALAIMFLVILIGWNFVIVRDLLYPLKVSDSGSISLSLSASKSC